MQPQPNLTLTISAFTHRGRRAVNEDHLAYHIPSEAYLRARKGIAFVVADGVGGHQAGQVASRLAAQTVMQHYYYDTQPDPLQSMERALAAAHGVVHAQARRDPAYAGMGTTMLAAVIRGSVLDIAHVGDGRAYLLRANRIWQLTRDHTWMAQMIQSGALSPEQAARHPYRHVLTQAIGGTQSPRVELRRYQLWPGDALALCTDGLYEWLRAYDLLNAMRRIAVAQAVAQLSAQALRRGSTDNLSAIVVRALSTVARAAQPTRHNVVTPRRVGLGAARA